MVEAAGNLDVEAQAHRVEEGQFIDGPGVDCSDAAVQQGVERLIIGGADAEVAPEPVAGAAGKQSQHGRRVPERGGDLVHRAIAADGDGEEAAVNDRTMSEVAGVARTRGWTVGR